MNNRYFKLTKPVTIYVLKGHKESNYYYGASNILKPIYYELSLLKGSEIHVLVGGTFAVERDDTVHEIRLSQPGEFAPFDKKYSSSSEKEIPGTDVSTEIEHEQALNVSSYRSKF